MDDPEWYDGPEFFSLSFGETVDRGLLEDYWVLMVAIDEQGWARQLANPEVT